VTIATAQIIVGTVEAYCAVGAVFAPAFLIRAVTRMDHGVFGAPLAMRILILPGVAALWPLLAWRWIHGFPAVVERTAHRTRAAASAPAHARCRPAGTSR
jgi:hypothetical protein